MFGGGVDSQPTVRRCHPRLPTHQLFFCSGTGWKQLQSVWLAVQPITVLHSLATDSLLGTNAVRVCMPDSAPGSKASRLQGRHRTLLSFPAAVGDLRFACHSTFVFFFFFFFFFFFRSLDFYKFASLARIRVWLIFSRSEATYYCGVLI
ncbi:hypothetical protein ASPWEDRAFT_280184 [Aspergillus wentii DTO 134E9]|uniref:Transmembrane protein n=1 Tax=Aspergillus wentii DTO 134E9 TaxID=1073089 RepID=A0A1L9S3E8_ASPWE|nr:uncharacterized protein ASPWEDRAFT_280184 [Aspergillus wentii DTO 134E9]OJJ41663.1 hypothetical protein ASPWEDRAFT_280184 [Aspergillus wentii DTO 134E9]